MEELTVVEVILFILLKFRNFGVSSALGMTFWGTVNLVELIGKESIFGLE